VDKLPSGAADVANVSLARVFVLFFSTDASRIGFYGFALAAW
jgi:hypothetical protein